MAQKKNQSNKTERPSAYQVINDLIVQRLEQGDIPWMQRYTPEQKALGPARNERTGTVYKGVNKLLLPPGRYSTYKGAKESGGQVRKGEKAHKIFKPITALRRDKDKDVLDPVTGAVITEGTRRIVVDYTYDSVFHESQIDWNEPLPAPKEEVYDGDPIEDAETLILEYRFREGVSIQDGAGEPGYVKETDTILIPLRSRYRSAEAYYLDLFHEMVHSTGAEHRLRRRLPAMAAKGHAASMEELTAEIGAAYLMDSLGMCSADTIDDTAAYCRQWIDLLRSDENALTRASSAADKAVAFILGN